MKSLFQLLSLVLMSAVLGCGPNQTTDLTQDDFTAKLDSLIATTSPRTFNGVILITQKGETLYEKAYGYASIEDQTPISLKDNFRIQSNSKQITAVLTLQQVEQGKIDLQVPIRQYLPDFGLSWADTVTVHQLLNMSSGIAGTDRPLLFEPGKGYHYSNPAYGLLGQIIENVSGSTYIEQANALFSELGMKNTYCYEVGKTNEGLIDAYRVDGNAFNRVVFDSLPITKESWKPFIPAGGIISNAHDLNLWDHQLHTGQLLKPALYELMILSGNIGQHDAFGPEEIGYGYGVRIYDKAPVKHIGHAGRGIGFANIKFYIPEKELCVIVLENVYNEDTSIVYHFEKAVRQIILESNLVK